MTKSYLQHKAAWVFALSILGSGVAWADNKAIAVDEMAAYMDFVEYNGGVMMPEQIPKEDWAKFTIIDTRDAAQYSKAHIPGAINIEWRKVLAEKSKIPKDKTVIVYCNTGDLSAQAGFALRVAGYENVRILNGGYNSFLAKGGFEANQRAAAATK